MSGDRNNTMCAPRPRRGGRTLCLAAGLSLAAIGVTFTLPADGEPAVPTTSPAATQPADAQAQTAAQALKGARPGARPRDGRPATGPAAIEPAEIPWDEIAAFMRQHSRLKFERWEQFDQPYQGPGRGPFDRHEMKLRLGEGIRSQYAQLKRIELDDPAEYKLEVRRVEIEDKIFGAAADYKRGAGDESKKALAREQMKQHVREYLALRDDLQKHRLERRKAELARQSKQIDKQLESLAEKPQPRDERITRLANRLLTDQPANLFGGIGGGGGPAPGAGGPVGPGAGQPGRDGGREGPEPRSRSGRAGPTTNRSTNSESPKGE